MGRRQTRGEDGLTDLERRFCVLYLRDFNATAAYREASGGRAALKTCEANGYKLLQRPEIRRRVAEERDRLMAKAELSVEDTLLRLRQAIHFDPRRMINSDGTPLPLQDLPDDIAFAIAGFDVVTIGNDEVGVGRVSKMKFVDRLAAIDKAMRHFGLFKEDNTQQAELLKKLAEGITVKLVKPNAD